jgi:hypothetical protein
VKIEEKFSKMSPSRLYECTVVVGNAMFLVAAYWNDRSYPNRAIKTVCRGLEWRGELAIVQAGRIVPYYKRVENPSAVNKAVSKYVSISLTRVYFRFAHFLDLSQSSATRKPC